MPIIKVDESHPSYKYLFWVAVPDTLYLPHIYGFLTMLPNTARHHKTGRSPNKFLFKPSAAHFYWIRPLSPIAFNADKPVTKALTGISANKQKAT